MEQTPFMEVGAWTRNCEDQLSDGVLHASEAIIEASFYD